MGLSSLTFAVALGWSQYTAEDGSEPRPHIRLEVGHEEHPWYVFKQFERPVVNVLGQSLDTPYTFSLGAGVKYPLMDRVYLLGEVGYTFVDTDEQYDKRQEVVFKELVNRHLTPNNPLPVRLTGRPFDTSSYGTRWGLGDGLNATLGVGYEITHKASVELRFRPLYLKETIELFDPEVRACGGPCGGWWEETNNLDFTAWQINLRWQF